MINSKELQNPIIFIGTGRSGTTILSEVIMRHPDLAYPSHYQEKFVKNSYVNLIRNIFENKFWTVYGQKRQLNKVNFLNKFAFRPSEGYKMWNYLTGEGLDFSRDFLIDKCASKERQQFIRNYFYKMIKYQNKKRLIFKVTGPTRISYLMSIFPDAYFVNIKRAKIPTISSFLKIDFWKSRGYDKIWWTGAYTKDEKQWAKDNTGNPILLTAFQIKKMVEISKYELEKYNPKYIEVNYEDFVGDKKKEVIKILKFLNLESNSSNCLSYLDNINIYKQNKTDDEYFNKKEIEDINNIFIQ